MGGFFSRGVQGAPVPLYLAPSPVYFPVKKSSGGHDVERLSLRSFIETRCPSLTTGYLSPWWLFNGHLQTIYCVLGDFSQIDKVIYDRTLLRLVDGGTLGLDFTPPEGERTLPDDTPIIVVLHGLTGGSHESYVRGILAPACTPLEEGGLGFRGVVVNFRGCAGVPITSGQLYSAGHTDDLRQALMYLAKRYPRARLMGVGYSLGANIMTRYIAEEGEDSRLIAGCALGCPWDLAKNSDKMEGTWFYRQLYSKSMGSNLSNLMKQHLKTFSALPPNRLTPILPELLSLKSPTLVDFDERVTRLCGGSSPPFPFSSAHHYYEWASSHKCLPGVRVPFLAINADDDPIVRLLPFDVGGNGLVALAVTRGGGHLGWFEVGKTRGDLMRWITKPVLEWLKAIGNDLGVERQGGRRLVEIDMFVTEEGREDLGYKVVEGGGRIVGVQGEEGLLPGL